MNLKRSLFPFLLAFLVGCAQLGVEPADTTAKRIAAGYSLVATVADGTTALLLAGKISKADAVNIKTGTDTALAGLAIVESMGPTPAADARLAQIIAVLTATQAYLASQGAKP